MMLITKNIEKLNYRRINIYSKAKIINMKSKNDFLEILLHIANDRTQKHKRIRPCLMFAYFKHCDFLCLLRRQYFYGD